MNPTATLRLALLLLGYVAARKYYTFSSHRCFETSWRNFSVHQKSAVQFSYYKNNINMIITINNAWGRRRVKRRHGDLKCNVKMAALHLAETSSWGQMKAVETREASLVHAYRKPWIPVYIFFDCRGVCYNTLRDYVNINKPWNCASAVFRSSIPILS